jgi:sugar phosphate isomerase/epimerase
MTVSGVLAANSKLSAATVSAFSKSNAKKDFGLQIYSLTINRQDQEYSSDIPGGLKKVAQMGYSTIELAGYNIEGKIGQIPMIEFKKYADDAGLKIVSSHLNPPVSEYTKDNIGQIKEFWKKASEYHAAIGCKYIIQPGQPATRSTEEVAFVGEVFNEAGKIAKAAGLIFGYHNHENEFRRVVPGGTEMMPLGRAGFGRQPEGIKMIYDGMMEATDPSLVVFENDVYWTVMGQQDPVAYMKKYANRIRLLHIKDVAILGESGMMNFQKIFETACANGISEFIVELEMYSGGSQLAGVKGCADYLLNANFVK